MSTWICGACYRRGDGRIRGGIRYRLHIWWQHYGSEADYALFRSESEVMTRDWKFQETGFAMFWSHLMQWRYVRILAFALVLLGYSRGWDVVETQFGPVVVIAMVGLTVMAFLDTTISGWKLIRGHGNPSKKSLNENNEVDP